MCDKIFKIANQFWFECPGCKEKHAFDNTWSFNNDLKNPTVSPSILVKRPSDNIYCHSFIKDGKIQFLGDCNHELKNQTVELPIWIGFKNE